MTGEGFELGAAGQDGLEPESFSISVSVSGRLRIHFVTMRGVGGCAVTGRGEVRFSRR
ncbi:hypothetical protein ACFVXE_33480 [Streptomyces sp. NPDC058231]|uniref:hypothetical protein n=1 Tax=Streptomyces sp. NPDC058231 TaxID=3346392 RepID=UPI0036DFEC2F